MDGVAVDPSARPFRRTFTAEYRARIVAEYEAAPHGEKSAVLRREGLYQSQARGDGPRRVMHRLAGRQRRGGRIGRIGQRRRAVRRSRGCVRRIGD